MQIYCSHPGKLLKNFVPLRMSKDISFNSYFKDRLSSSQLLFQQMHKKELQSTSLLPLGAILCGELSALNPTCISYYSSFYLH